MKTKISKIAIVCPEYQKNYVVGANYDGLLLDRIEDKSAEFQNSLTIIYNGYTAENELVFELINASIDVQYCAIGPEKEDNNVAK